MPKYEAQGIYIHGNGHPVPVGTGANPAFAERIAKALNLLEQMESVESDVESADNVNRGRRYIEVIRRLNDLRNRVEALERSRPLDLDEVVSKLAVRMSRGLDES